MSLHLQHFIAGQASEASGGQRMNLVNPINEEVYASAAHGTAEDVARAVAAARAQLDGGAWSRLSG
ncbi:aldehyde dehydrogenase family protein, partial [Salmonella enterica]|uniref:aldehyde dehydrogenase family protein n=1 Tax=Salmonella enterica TaxID=28901 RepID=UPI003CEF9882